MTNSDIGIWLAEIRERTASIAPDLTEFFDIYSAEAIFGREYIDEDLKELTPGSSILEIGAGSLLLSTYLAKEGFAVFALEPVGEGFSHFSRMRKIVLSLAEERGLKVTLLNLPGEQLDIRDRFDLAFSVNVMEHVGDFQVVIGNVGRSLKPGAIYRFTCPNYLFPYEPHFNIPTLFSKSLTERVFRGRIGRSAIPDPAGTWNSLNWINVMNVRSAVAQFPDLRVSFGTTLLRSTLDRAVNDENFANRRSPAIIKIIGLAHRIGFVKATKWIPPVLQPSMDCVIKRTQAW